MTSKSNSSSGVAPTPLSHYNDQGVRERWPVLVYRLQSHRGWEVYSDPDNIATATSTPASSGKKTNAAAEKSTKGGNSGANNISTVSVNDASSKGPHTVEDLTVAPREGCIEVRKMRLRIQLFEQHTPWDPNQPHPRSRARRCVGEKQPKMVAHGKEIDPKAGGPDKSSAHNDKNNDSEHYDSDAPGADGWNDNSLLVRRRNTLLVTTRRGMGAVVFQFKSTKDCIDFGDRLTYLNREYLAPPPCEDDVDTPSNRRTRSTTFDHGDGYVNGMGKRESQIDEMRSDKRRKCADIGSIATKLVRRPRSEVMNDEAPAASEEIKQYQRQDEIMSYIVQLAHSEEFRGFVEELERGLQSASDTSAIHAALGA